MTDRSRLVASRGFTQAINDGLTERAAGAITGAVQGMIRTRENLSGSEWADKYRVMPQSARHRRWSTALTPYLKEVADFLSDDDPAHQVIVFGKCAQAGGSETALNEVLRRIHADPCTILYYMESADKAKAWMSERLDPALRRSPFQGIRFRQYNMVREFPGGQLICSGVGSSAALSSVTARVVVGDEVARYPLTIGGEGDFLSLARQRVVTHGDRGKILLVSTFIDAVRGEGTFMEYWEAGDKREYRCPCPDCGELWHWNIEAFRRLETGECVMICPHCGGMTHDGDQRAELVAAGGWAPTQEAPVEGMISYQLSGFVVPGEWRPWGDIFAAHAAAVSGKTSLQSFHNLVLGLPYDEPEARIPAVTAIAKAAQAERYREGTLPDPVALLTMAVDVQGDYLDVEVKGWAEDLENWSILRTQIRASVKEDTDLCARELRKIMARRFMFADGRSLSVWLGCIDRGFQASAVDKVVSSFPRPSAWRGGYAHVPHGTMTASKGASQIDPPRLLMGEPGGKTMRTMRRRHGYWLTGVPIAKVELYTALNLMVRGEAGKPVRARVHAPVERNEDYFSELTAEQVETRISPTTGKVQRVFKLPPRRANEALDLHVMNRICAEILRLPELDDKAWRAIRARIVPAAKAEPKPVDPSMTPAARRAAARRKQQARRRERRGR